MFCSLNKSAIVFWNRKIASLKVTLPPGVLYKLPVHRYVPFTPKEGNLNKWNRFSTLTCLFIALFKQTISPVSRKEAVLDKIGAFGSCKYKCPGHQPSIDDEAESRGRKNRRCLDCFGFGNQNPFEFSIGSSMADASKNNLCKQTTCLKNSYRRWAWPWNRYRCHHW